MEEFLTEEIINAGFPIKDLIDSGYVLPDFQLANVDPKLLLPHFPLGEMRAVGYTPSELNKFYQLGETIVGEFPQDRSGWKVAISSNNDIIVGTTSKFNSEHGPNTGHVRIFRWNEPMSGWEQMGNDIDGSSPDEEFGKSIAFNNDGTIVAIGAAMNNDAGYRRGRLGIYQWDGMGWIPMGNDIHGDIDNEQLGWETSLNGDGTIVAVSSHLSNGGRGKVSVFQWDGAIWTPMGDKILGDASGDRTGQSISINNDGTILAIGVRDSDGTNGLEKSGQVRVYQWDSPSLSWVQMGSYLDGEGTRDQFGWDVSLSSDGTILAAAGRHNDEFANNAGHVRIFKWDSSSLNWSQMGEDIDGINSGNKFGNALSLNSDGTKIVVGAPFANPNGNDSGRAKVYQWDPSLFLWSQMGNAVVGESSLNQLGTSVAINNDGSIIVVGEPYGDVDESIDTTTNEGFTKIYRYVTPAGLRSVGFTAGELIGDGFIIRRLKEGGYPVGEVIAEGTTLEDIRVGGYPASELVDFGSTAVDLVNAGYPIEELKAVGFPASTLRDAGVSAENLKLGGFTAGNMKLAGFLASELLTVGYNVLQLKAGGFNAGELRDAGINAEALRLALFTSAQVRDGGFSAEEMRAGGFDAGEMRDAGFTAGDLLPIGYTAINVKLGGYSATEAKGAGYADTDMRSAGYTAAQMRDAGCTPAQLKVAGFLAGEMRNANFSASDLAAVGYTAGELKTGNYSALLVAAAGYTAAEMILGGFTATQLRPTNFPVDELRDGGLNVAQLKTGGYLATELKDFFNIEYLKNANFTVAQMKVAGYTALQLRLIGCTATDLRNEGFLIGEMKSAKFPLQELISAGFTNNEILGADFLAGKLQNLGFNILQLRNNEYPTTEILNAGYTDEEIYERFSNGIKLMRIYEDHVNANGKYPF